MTKTDRRPAGLKGKPVPDFVPDNRATSLARHLLSLGYVQRCPLHPLPRTEDPTNGYDFFCQDDGDGYGEFLVEWHTDRRPVAPLGYPDEAGPTAEEVEALRERAEAAERELAELKAKTQPDEEDARPLPPVPSETLMTDYGKVGQPDPVEEEITTEHLLDAMRTDADAAGDVIAKLSRDKRRRFTELLNVELAELQQLHGAAGENLERESDIEKLLGLFARVGEM